jgi:excisionase family DNA binding protein
LRSTASSTIKPKQKKNGKKLKIMEIIAKALTAYYEPALNENAVEPAVQNNVSETTETHDDKEQETESANTKRMNSLGYLTIEQAHEYLGINLQIISSARKNGELGSKKVGKRFFYKKEDLDIWFEIYLETKGDKTEELYQEQQKNKAENQTLR